MTDTIEDHGLVLFDGVCNFCNSSVTFILKRDKKGYFKFASLQSPIAENLLKQHGMDNTDLNTVVVLDKERVYTKSRAFLHIAAKLGGAWPLATVFRIVPPIIRDAVYDTIARNRYRWFGKKEACMIPRIEWKSRFVG